jgi:hypothetical protein
VVFIDESQSTINDASSPDSGPDEFETAWGSPPVISEVSSNKSPPVSAGMPPFRPPSPPDRLRLMMISSVVNPPAPNWPLTNPEEARLFRHFVERLAMWVRHPMTPTFPRWPGTVRLTDNILSSTCATQTVCVDLAIVKVLVDMIIDPAVP